MGFKQIKYILFTLICIFATPLVTHAECDYQRQAELSRLASNVQFSYTYDSNMNFTINVTNITDDIYVSYFNPGNLLSETLSGSGEKNIQAGAGVTIDFEIYSNDSNCKGDKLLTKYVSTPSPNRFYQFDECKKYPNFKYCQLWLNTAIDINQFKEEFNKYEASLNQKDTNETSNSSVLDEILLFMEDHSFVLIFGFSLIILLIVTIIIIKVVRRR